MSNYRKSKIKKKILKEARGKKHLTYRGPKIRIISDFSSEIMHSKREWHKILKMFREKPHQLQVLYPAKLSFKSEGEIRTFSDRQIEFVAKRPTLQEMVYLFLFFYPHQRTCLET